MFWFHKLWNFDSFNRFKIGLSLRTSAEYVPWFSAALFAFLVIAVFCTFISFSLCTCEDPDSSGAFLVHGMICAGQISWVSGALAFWGLFCTVTLLFFTTPVLVVFSALSGCAFVFYVYLGMGQACCCSFMDPSIYTFTCLVAVYLEVQGIYWADHCTVKPQKSCFKASLPSCLLTIAAEGFVWQKDSCLLIF